MAPPSVQMAGLSSALNPNSRKGAENASLRNDYWHWHVFAAY
jgi:hypothetical protein